MTPADKLLSTCSVEGSFYREPISHLLLRDRSDAHTLLEMRRDYGKLSPHPGGTALDLGGSTGVFAWFALNQLTVGTVVSIEPLPEHVELFKLNLGEDPRVKLMEAAVTNDEEAEVELYVGRTYSHCSSLTPLRGATSIKVPTVRWSEVLEDVSPDVVKCDIEGAEHALPWDDLPSSVSQVAMEMHQRRSGWIESGKRIDDQLLASGFQHVKAPRHQHCYNSIQIAVWRR